MLFPEWASADRDQRSGKYFEEQFGAVRVMSSAMLHLRIL